MLVAPLRTFENSDIKFYGRGIFSFIKRIEKFKKAAAVYFIFEVYNKYTSRNIFYVYPLK